MSLLAIKPHQWKSMLIHQGWFNLVIYATFTLTTNYRVCNLHIYLYPTPHRHITSPSEKSRPETTWDRYHDLPKRTGTDFRGYRNGLSEYRNRLWEPKRTGTDRNGPKRTFVDTETDSLSTETDSLGTETDRNGPKRTFVNTETDSVGTES